MPDLLQAAVRILPDDASRAVLAGRVWRPEVGGPAVVGICDGMVFDVSRMFPTMRDLCEAPDPAAALAAAVGRLAGGAVGGLADEGSAAAAGRVAGGAVGEGAAGVAGRAVGSAAGDCLGGIDAILANTPPETRDPTRPWLLAPVDLQALKAAGVTFAISMLERVIEERARGDLSAAATIRAEVTRLVGDDLARLKPGSAEAMRLKEVLIQQGAWSQYLEVGIGPDAEIFTKAQPMAAVGTAVDAGIHPASAWNNPEPEVVLIVASSGAIVGAALGNDVNLRDVEGRSALLLSKAKDNNASCAIGPFIRLFDAGFGLDDIRRTTVTLRVEGEDGFVLEGASSIARISRDPAELVAQMVNTHHRYPDGAALFLGTMFAPIEDRDAPGQGFTHKNGDVVTIAAPGLGRLVNRMRPTDACEPWAFGVGALMRNLAARGLLS